MVIGKCGYVERDDKSFCYGLYNTPVIDTGDCGKCGCLEKCSKETNQSVRVLK